MDHRIIRPLLHHDAEALPRDVDGVIDSNPGRVSLITRNVYTLGLVHGLSDSRLIEPKPSYWNLYS